MQSELRAYPMPEIVRQELNRLTRLANSLRMNTHALREELKRVEAKRDE